MDLIDFFKRLKGLPLLEITYDDQLWYDEVLKLELIKETIENDKVIKLRLVEVTSGHDRFWFEVSGAPPIRFNELDSLFTHLKNELEG